MRGSKKYNVISFRMKPAFVGVVLIAGLGALVLSCGEVDRHDMLTFFFDGVPPMGSQGYEEEFVKTNSQEPELAGQEPVWYVHEPQKDCANCHQKQRTGRFSPQTRLLAPVPNLCYKCHSDYTAGASFVHGPVAVGQCLFCHNPHRSKVRHLLNAPEPKLCFRCHEVSMIELIPAHLAQQTSACTDCHNPHAGATKSLLKGPDSTMPRAPKNGAMADAAIQNNAAPVKERSAETTAIERQSLFEIFWQVSGLIEQGEMTKARAQLEALKDNKALTAQEKEKILYMLRLMDSASAESKPGESGAKTAQGGDLSRQEREVADLYYRSIAYYRDGQLVKAREGFVEVLKSRLIPDLMAETIQRYVTEIDRTLAGNTAISSQGPLN